MKIWILTSKFGQGHFSAAKSLEEELVEQGHDVIVSDIIKLTHPLLSRAVYAVFNHIICRNAGIYNFLNEFGRNPKEKKSHSKIMDRAIAEIKPDMIITTWSACARKLDPSAVPVYVCITDMGVHAGWLQKGVKGYFVASIDVKKQLIAMGIANAKIHISGIPVKKVFRTTEKKTNPAKNILIMGGGLGILPWIDELLNELGTHPEIKITVIAGNNQRLFHRLKLEYPSITVVGFTNKVHQYMSQADLLVSKPGGVSLFEAIYTETPCVAVYPEYKHEIENANYILNQNIGEVIWKDQSAGDRIVQLLDDNDRRMKFHSNLLDIKQEMNDARTKVNWGCRENAV